MLVNGKLKLFFIRVIYLYIIMKLPNNIATLSSLAQCNI